MTEAIFKQLNDVPKSALQAAAQQHSMPQYSTASKEDLAQWLTQNKPDVAKQVIQDPTRFTT